jgi:hypothetical protein
VYDWKQNYDKLFPDFLTNGTLLEQSNATKNKFWFSLQIVTETFLILRSMERDMIANVYFSSIQYVITFHILMKFEFSRHTFQKY